VVAKVSSFVAHRSRAYRVPGYNVAKCPASLDQLKGSPGSDAVLKQEQVLRSEENLEIVLKCRDGFYRALAILEKATSRL
jgi:hypothetical protein